MKAFDGSTSWEAYAKAKHTEAERLAGRAIALDPHGFTKRYGDLSKASNLKRAMDDEVNDILCPH